MKIFSILNSFLFLLTFLQANELHNEFKKNNIDGFKILSLDLSEELPINDLINKAENNELDLLLLKINKKPNSNDVFFDYLEKQFNHFFILESSSNFETLIYIASQYEIINPMYEDQFKTLHFIIKDKSVENHIYAVLEKQNKDERIALADEIKRNMYRDNLSYLLCGEINQMDFDYILSTTYMNNFFNNSSLAMARPSGRVSISAKSNAKGDASLKGSATVESETKDGKGHFSGSINGSISRDSKENVNKEVEVMFSFEK